MHTPDNAPTTEQTPLLSGASSQGNDTSCNRTCAPAPPKPIHEPLLHKAVTLAFVFLSLLLCLAVAIVLTAHSYATPLLRADPASLAQQALAFNGPSHVNVLNYTADGIWCEVAGAAAVDVALAMRLSSNRFSDRLVGWAVRQVGHITVSTSTVNIYSLEGTHLSSVRLPEIVLPLATRTPPSLANITIQTLVKPARNSQDLVDFAMKSWQRGFLEVRVDVSKVVVVGGRKAHSYSWRNRVHVAKKDVSALLKVVGRYILPSHCVLIPIYHLQFQPFLASLQRPLTNHDLFPILLVSFTYNLTTFSPRLQLSAWLGLRRYPTLPPRFYEGPSLFLFLSLSPFRLSIPEHLSRLLVLKQLHSPLLYPISPWRSLATFCPFLLRLAPLPLCLGLPRTS